MRLWILSDLHISPSDARAGYWRDVIPDADVAVVAGDVCEGVELSIGWLATAIAPHMPVVAVLGNHELYGEEVPSAYAHARRYAEARGVHLLQDSEVEIGGLRFLGCTLWTDYRLYAGGNRAGREAAEHAAKSLPDHRQIWMDQIADGMVARLMRPHDARQMHRESYDWLDRTMDSRPTVVVTHHAPHPMSVAPRWQGDAVTPAYVSDLSSLIDRRQPALWVHGHTHTSFDYLVEPLDGSPTRVICNPRGHGGWEDAAFDPVLTVEV